MVSEISNCILHGLRFTETFHMPSSQSSYCPVQRVMPLWSYSGDSMLKAQKETTKRPSKMHQRPRPRPRKLEAKEQGSRVPNRGKPRISQLKITLIINLVQPHKVQQQVAINKHRTRNIMLVEPPYQPPPYHKPFQLPGEFLDKSF